VSLLSAFSLQVCDRPLVSAFEVGSCECFDNMQICMLTIAGLLPRLRDHYRYVIFLQFLYNASALISFLLV
jgi:hypothetical protein